jgi:ubiquitin-protein ligase
MDCFYCKRKLDHEFFDLKSSSFGVALCKNIKCLESYTINYHSSNHINSLMKKSFDTFVVMIYLVLCAERGRYFDPRPLNYHRPTEFNGGGDVDINQIENVVKKIVSNNYKNDLEYKNNVSIGMYSLFKFIALMCNINFQKEFKHDTDLFSCYKLMDTQKEQEFKNVQGFKSSHFNFHGSSNEKWYSIVMNGVKNYSNTRHMSAGAAYGPGIYLSNDYNMSKGYSNRSSSINESSSIRSGDCILGVYQIKGEQSMYHKSHSVYVVPDEKMLILRYLTITNDPTKSMEWLLNYLHTTTTTKQTRGVKRLFKEYSNLVNKKENGISVELINNEFTKWQVQLSDFDKDSELYNDLKRNGIKNIILHVYFSDQYPFHPPFIRVISPTFHPRTAHITNAGAICMELLTLQNWSQLMNIENVLIQIKSLILEGNGRILNTHGTYGDLESAKVSFTSVSKAHGWM